MDVLHSWIDEEVAAFRPLLAPDVGGFLSRVYAKDLSEYRHRLQAYGFNGLGRVLDAGCGFGQWALAMAASGDDVCAVDVAAERLLFLHRLLQHPECPQTIETVRAELDRTGFEADSFDGVFCYGVLFLTRWKETLAEFARILKPGGRLYVNANGMGWYKHLWYSGHNASAGYDPQALFSKTLANTLKYRRGLPIEPGIDILIEPEDMLEELTALGFVQIEISAEGTLGQSEEKSAFFEGTYHGDTGVYEVLARKNDGVK